MFAPAQIGFVGGSAARVKLGQGTRWLRARRSLWLGSATPIKDLTLWLLVVAVSAAFASIAPVPAPGDCWFVGICPALLLVTLTARRCRKEDSPEKAEGASVPEGEYAVHGQPVVAG
jgi:hypothetical protein